MKTKLNNSPYATAFWAMMINRAHNADDLHNSRQKEAEGFYFPDDTLMRFRDEQKKMNIFRQIATVMNIGSAETRIKVLPPSGEADFVGEGVAIPESTETITDFNIESYKIAKLTKITHETLRDVGFNLEAALIADFGRAFGLAEENGMINGNGINRPNGLLHPTKGAEIGVTATGTLNFDHVRELFFSLGAEFRKNACWLMNDETALFVRTLKDSTGGYIWNDFDNSIFGKPVHTTPYMPSVAAGNTPVLFGDFRFLWLMERAGVVVKPLVELYAEHGITGYVCTEFMDSRLVKREAVKGLAIAE